MKKLFFVFLSVSLAVVIVLKSTRNDNKTVIVEKIELAEKNDKIPVEKNEEVSEVVELTEYEAEKKIVKRPSQKRKKIDVKVENFDELPEEVSFLSGITNSEAGKAIKEIFLSDNSLGNDLSEDRFEEIMGVLQNNPREGMKAIEEAIKSFPSEEFSADKASLVLLAKDLEYDTEFVEKILVQELSQNILPTTDFEEVEGEEEIESAALREASLYSLVSIYSDLIEKSGDINKAREDLKEVLSRQSNPHFKHYILEEIQRKVPELKGEFH